MRERVHESELERLLANREDIGSPFIVEYAPGKWLADGNELRTWRANRQRLIGYAPGQEPPMQ